MKKLDPPLRKNATARDANKSQKKLYGFFTKLSSKDNIVQIGDKSPTKSEICRKRYLTDHVGSSERNVKILKCSNRSDENMHKDTECNGTFASPRKDVSSKENTNVDVVDNSQTFHKTPNKQLSKQNVISTRDNVRIDSFNKSQHEAETLLETYIADDFSDCFEEEWTLNTQIDLNSLQRCKITDVKREYDCTVLTVGQENIDSSATIKCLGFWKDVKIEKNDIVALQARKETRYWVVDNSSGFLVIHPDLLVSGTTVVGALFCTRKAVLAEKFRKIESLPYYKGDSTAMVIGNLAHQLLQKAICQNVCDLSGIQNLMDTLLNSKETIETLYASEIKFDACRKEMLAFVPKIFDFIQHYLKGKKQQEINNLKNNNYKGEIVHIRDIEENIWLPKLGIKGKVDVSVEVNINSKRKIMPLEIKTGRPSFSIEHRGQVILYIMMMALTGQDTDTGLLLYLRDNSMQEIKSGHAERRDLILLRNTLANYFNLKTLEGSLDLTSKSEYEAIDLPEPINHHSACSKCSYNALCCMYLTKDTKTQLSESHPLTQVSKQIMEKFKPTHIDYVVKWIALLQMEETAQSPENMVKFMWTLSPEKREARKTCICNLKVIGKVLERNSKYQHIFVRSNIRENDSNTNVVYNEFVENEYVLVSTDTRMNISAGFIINIKKDAITILLDRNITKYNINESFHIDKYSSSNLYSFNLANVGGLMGDDETCAKLRDIVIDRKPATFASALSRSIVEKSTKILSGLNENQQRAVLKVMTANEYVLIKGMPGTGKTETLVALIELLHEMGQSVIITAHTNNAVDNILLKLLKKGIDFLRLGSSSQHPLLKHKTEAYVTASCDSPDSLEAVYSSKNIIGVTCYGAHHALLGARTFDVCVVDESAQALQPVVLRPLYSARKFVLVGDPDQLAPVIKSKVAKKLGADESLFVRLDSDNNTVKLTKQYRMNKNIMHLANKLTYNDALEAGNASIANATFSSIHGEILKEQEEWIQKALSRDLNDSVIVLDTGRTSDLELNDSVKDKYPRSDGTYLNIWEAAVVSKLQQVLVRMDVKPENVGIIAPYRAHVNLLRKIVHKDVEVNTVDQYQGRDKEIILYSCVMSSINNSNMKRDFEILGDHGRLTVAITRAKHKLIIIADKSTISQCLLFKKLFSLIDDKQVIDLNNSDDFSWKTILSCL